MLVALQAVEGEPFWQRMGKCRQLVGDKLVGKGVGLCRNAYGHVVALGKEDLWQQVGNGLSNTRTRLYCPVCRGGKRVSYLERHRDLLWARLVVLVHASDYAARGELVPNGLWGWGDKRPIALGSVCALPRLLAGDQPVTQCLERERLGAPLDGKVRNDGPKGPLYLGMHLGELAQEPCWQVREPKQDDAPHATERVNVVAGAVRDRVAAKRLCHVRESVGREARKRDARERKRVNPGVRHLGASAYALDEGAVEGRIVCQHRGAAHKVCQGAHGLLGVGGGRDIYVAYARKALDLWRNRPAGIDKGLKAVDRLTAREPRGGYLYELTILEREARSLRVEHNDVLFKQVKPMGVGPLGKA